MSMMRKRAVLICDCCQPCYTVLGGLKYHVGITAEDFGISIVDGVYRWSNEFWGNHEYCHRLLVWEGITVADNAVPASIGDPGYVLKSNYGAQYRADNGPFYDDWPTNTSRLDAAPYWWSKCRRGGYELTTITRIPTGTDVNTYWDEAPIPDGTYTLLVGVEARRLYKGAIWPATGPVDAVSEEDAQYLLAWARMQPE